MNPYKMAAYLSGEVFGQIFEYLKLEIKNIIKLEIKIYKVEVSFKLIIAYFYC